MTKILYLTKEEEQTLHWLHLENYPKVLAIIKEIETKDLPIRATFERADYEIGTAYYGLGIRKNPDTFLVPKYIKAGKWEHKDKIWFYYCIRIPKDKVPKEWLKEKWISLCFDICEWTKEQELLNKYLWWDGDLEGIDLYNLREQDGYVYFLVINASVFD